MSKYEMYEWVAALAEAMRDDRLSQAATLSDHCAGLKKLGVDEDTRLLEAIRDAELSKANLLTEALTNLKAVFEEKPAGKFLSNEGKWASMETESSFDGKEWKFAYKMAPLKDEPEDDTVNLNFDVELQGRVRVNSGGRVGSWGEWFTITDPEMDKKDNLEGGK